jgi:hypothetical protein
VATWDDVRRIALALPETTEKPAYGNVSWRINDKLFVWERPLRDKEVEELGEAAPDGPILGARVEDLAAKEAMLAEEPELYFTTSHFDGYPSVLVRLERIDEQDLGELIAEAWLARAPKRLAQEYLEERGLAGGGSDGSSSRS